MPFAHTHALPPIGTTWSYRRHPGRLYQVIYLANVAHQHPSHPATVVYRAVAHPAHVYTRTVDEFYRDFAASNSAIPSVLVPRGDESRCADALRGILAAGKPNLAHPQYRALLKAGCQALEEWNAGGSRSPSSLPPIEILIMDKNTSGETQLKSTIDAKVVSLAKALAHMAHAGQEDKAGHPYIGHVSRVAARVAGDPLAESVAWLHDVLEDRPAYADDVYAFPQQVVEAVKLLSREAGVPKETYYARIRQSAVALRVKAADLEDNSDEARLALLPEATASRLRDKYRFARGALGIAHNHGAPGGDVA